MSYFPGDIPFMSKEELRENGIKIPKDATETNAGDTISRQAAIDAILGQPPEPHYPSWYAEQIKQLPPAQPEIIRCKDCKHWIPYGWMFSEVWQSKNIADYPEDEIGCDCCDMAMKANDFCSRAERRTDE